MYSSCFLKFRTFTLRPMVGGSNHYICLENDMGYYHDNQALTDS